MNQLELPLETVKCDLCEGDIKTERNDQGEVYWNQGHNAYPVARGRACDDCHNTEVLPARMQQHVDNGDISITILEPGTFFKG